jgi:hypothetical protein
MRKPTSLMITLALGFAAVALAQEVPRGVVTQEAAATRGLALLRTLSAEKPREAGFGSGADAARATLGTPLAVYNVDLRALSAFKPGDDAGALIVPSPAAFYPVLVDGAVRSSVRVEKSDAGWEAARVGNAGLAVAVATGRRAFAGSGDSDTALVQVLALNLLFVARKEADGWQLAPVVDDSSVDLKVGRTERAASVFARLAPIAARHNGDPT